MKYGTFLPIWRYYYIIVECITEYNKYNIKKTDYGKKT